MHPQRAFTLIELLVVIAVIAVLAALLFPVFSRARDRGRQAACVSNEKQIGLAAALYTEDYDEIYPLGHSPAADPLTRYDDGGYEMHLIDLLRPYVKNRRVEGVWRCLTDPSEPVEQAGGVKDLRTSYSVNAWFEYGASLAQVEQPSSKIYLHESTDDDHFHWWEMGHPGKTYPILPISDIPPGKLKEQVALKRHSEGASYLYADWHVKWSRFPPLWGVTRETNAFWP